MQRPIPRLFSIAIAPQHHPSPRVVKRWTQARRRQNFLLNNRMPRQTEPTSCGPALEAIVLAHAPPDQAVWFEKGLPPTQGELARGRFFGTYAGCSRRLSDSTPLNADELAVLQAHGAVSPQVHSVADLARAALLLRAFQRLDAEDRAALFKEAYQKGDNGEQVSTLRALCFLPEPSDFLETAVDATRTNVLQVFEALSSDNPYPSKYFPDLHFNQLVMKTLFMGLPVSKIAGYQTRVTPELVRMALDFASERRAAQREVPADIGLIQAALTARDLSPST